MDVNQHDTPAPAGNRGFAALLHALVLPYILIGISYNLRMRLIAMALMATVLGLWVFGLPVWACALIIVTAAWLASVVAVSIAWSKLEQVSSALCNATDGLEAQNRSINENLALLKARLGVTPPPPKTLH